MEIKLLGKYGLEHAMFGLGFSYNLTSEYDNYNEVPLETVGRIHKIASNLCIENDSECKFLRQVFYHWDILAPRYLFQEIDQYKIGTTTQSQSTMHTISHRRLTQNDFEDYVPTELLDAINNEISIYKDTKSYEVFLKIKNILPEGFLQRRVWSMSLANMKNIYHQRRAHKLHHWKTICTAFYDATPSFLKVMFN